MVSLSEALAAGPVVLDGGLATELERRGHDLSSSLWSARLLHDDPGAISDVHRSFVRVGAQVLTTASYQASIPGFIRAGMDRGTAAALITRSVALARSVAGEADHPVWVAGSAGPYGAMLADGSEYTGNYGEDVELAQLRAFHREQIARLFEAGADVIACETIPSMTEAEAVVAELDDLCVPGWVSLTTVTRPDGAVVTRRGEAAEQVFALARGTRNVLAAGVNCTSPSGIEAAVTAAAKATDLPVVAYPNSGEGWDAVARSWTGSGRTTFDARLTAAWLDAGARMVGGCCRVSPAEIAQLTGFCSSSAHGRG